MGRVLFYTFLSMFLLVFRTGAVFARVACLGSQPGWLDFALLPLLYRQTGKRLYQHDTRQGLGDTL